MQTYSSSRDLLENAFFADNQEQERINQLELIDSIYSEFSHTNFIQMFVQPLDLCPDFGKKAELSGFSSIVADNQDLNKVFHTDSVYLIRYRSTSEGSMVKYQIPRHESFRIPFGFMNIFKFNITWKPEFHICPQCGKQFTNYRNEVYDIPKISRHGEILMTEGTLSLFNTYEMLLEPDVNGNQFALWILEPLEGIELKRVRNNLSNNLLKIIKAQMKNVTNTLVVPEFKIQSAENLEKSLNAMSLSSILEISPLLPCQKPADKYNYRQGKMESYAYINISIFGVDTGGRSSGSDIQCKLIYFYFFKS